MAKTITLLDIELEMKFGRTKHLESKLLVLFQGNWL